MMYQGVVQVQDFDKVMETDHRYVRTYSITPRLGSVEDVERYLMGKINIGATFCCIAEDTPGIPINRTIGFGILDDTGKVEKVY